jgi:hypothetical protein
MVYLSIAHDIGTAGWAAFGHKFGSKCPERCKRSVRTPGIWLLTQHLSRDEENHGTRWSRWPDTVPLWCVFTFSYQSGLSMRDYYRHYLRAITLLLQYVCVFLSFSNKQIDGKEQRIKILKKSSFFGKEPIYFIIYIYIYIYVHIERPLLSQRNQNLSTIWSEYSSVVKQPVYVYVLRSYASQNTRYDKTQISFTSSQEFKNIKRLSTTGNLTKVTCVVIKYHVIITDRNLWTKC